MSATTLAMPIENCGPTAVALRCAKTLVYRFASMVDSRSNGYATIVESRTERRRTLALFRYKSNQNDSEQRSEAYRCDVGYSHQLVVEDGGAFERVSLPSTDRVDVIQRLCATSPGSVEFDYVTLLRPGSGGSERSAIVRAILVRVDTGESVSILDRFVTGSDGGAQRAASSSREQASISLPSVGAYELVFTTAVDSCSPGAEAHLLVDNLRIKNVHDEIVDELASISTVGRVQS